MRILLLTTKYHAKDRGPYLSNEMVSELVANGHFVQVVSLEWEPIPAIETWTEGPLAQVLRIPTPSAGGTLARLRKWSWSSIHAHAVAAEHLADARYDLLFVFAPATPLHALIRWAMARSTRSFLYITDFFPFHQRFLGLIGPWPLFAAARSSERSLVRRFDAIGCMSEAGLTYLRRHYPLRPGQSLTAIPPWSAAFSLPPVDAIEERRRRDLPLASPILLFGGQIVEGRGIETIIKAARIAGDKALDITFVMIGSGRLATLVEQEIASGLRTLRLLPPEPRESYLALAAACDIGLVVTVPDVDVPTFPSKTIDYLRVGLPVLAAVETSTDYGRLIEEWGVGRAIEAGDAARLLDAAMEMLGDGAALKRMRGRGPAAARDRLSVQAAARAVGAATGCPIGGA